jgi:hypothetical protein
MQPQNEKLRAGALSAQRNAFDRGGTAIMDAIYDNAYAGRRKHPRQEVNVPGHIIQLNEGSRLGSLIRCNVVNFSEIGALVQIDPRVHIDSRLLEREFYLELNAEPGNLRSCSVVRRLGHMIGVKFVHSFGKM